MLRQKDKNSSVHRLAKHTVRRRKLIFCISFSLRSWL